MRGWLGVLDRQATKFLAASVFLALAQFPIFILPVLLKPLYGRLLPVK